MTSGCGGGSVMPTTTALASPRVMASTAILSATPNDAHAATGANAGPTMRPIIDTCDAGMFEMFQSRFGDTAAHGSSGQPHFLFSARTLFNFWRIVVSFADPDDGGTGSDWISAASARYCRSVSLFAAQNSSHACLASIQSSQPMVNSSGSRGAAGSCAPSTCARNAAQRSGVAQNSFHFRSARSYAIVSVAVIVISPRP